MDRTVPVRRSLLVNLVGVIVLLSTAIIVTFSLGSRRAIRTLSEELIDRTITATAAELDHYFEPVRNGLILARGWGEAGMLDDDRWDELTDLFQPFMIANPQISSLMVADSRGREFLLLKSAGTWINRRTRRDEWNDTVRVIEWPDGDEAARQDSRDELDYDPRRRPWFTGALGAAEGALHWTRPYIFFTTKDPGITASLTFTVGDGLEHVIGFDVLLSDISFFTSKVLEVSEHGKVIVLTDEGQVIGLPRDDRFATPETRRAALLRAPDELGLDVVTDARAAIGPGQDTSSDLVRFESGGEMWWGAAQSYARLAPDRPLWIAVFIPERDLLGGLSRLRLWVIVGALVVLALAILRVIVLARRYSHPLEQLVRESDRISRGDLEPGDAISSSVTEVRKLAAAHDRMRIGLKSLMKLERDLQLARQIQQSTFPKSLPRMRTFEIGAWSEPAEETGGDTYDVIGYTYDVLSLEEASAPGGDGERDEEVGRALLLLADATGHGIGPALAVTQIRAMLRMALRTGQDLPAIARHLNDQLCADLPSDRFITAWIGLIDDETGTLTSYSAGQAPLLLYDVSEDSFDVWNADTIPFGVASELPTAARPSVPLEKGDLFVVISDGIYEAQGPGGEQFGKERVKRIVAREHARTPQQIIGTIRDAVDRFTGGVPADDDRTALIIKRI